MNTIRLILQALSMVPDHYQSHKISCWIILGINLLGVIAGIRKTFLLSRAMKGVSAFLYIVLRVLLLFGSLSFGLMLLLASKVAEASPERFGFGFYIEIIAAGIILLVLLAREIEGDDTEETAKSILATLFVVILSVIFMIFGNGMIRWGFSLFGKRVGAWFFGVYAGWAVDVIFNLLTEVTDLTFTSLRESVDRMPQVKHHDHNLESSKGTAYKSSLTGSRSAGSMSSQFESIFRKLHLEDDIRRYENQIKKRFISRQEKQRLEALLKDAKDELNAINKRLGEP